MTWICKDPEAGYYVDEFAGTHVYEDRGQTIAQQFPEQFFQCPWWAGLIFRATARLHNYSMYFISRWDI